MRKVDYNLYKDCVKYYTVYLQNRLFELELHLLSTNTTAGLQGFFLASLDDQEYESFSLE